MNIKRITIIQITVTVILAVIFFFVLDFKVALGIIIGSSLGYFNLYSLNKRINEISDEEVPNLKRIIKKNRNFRYLVLLSILIIVGLVPELFNLIATCFSVLISRIIITIELFINKNK